MGILELENVSFSYGKTKVLDNISYSFDAVSYTHLDVYKRQILCRLIYLHSHQNLHFLKFLLPQTLFLSLIPI